MRSKRSGGPAQFGKPQLTIDQAGFWPGLTDEEVELMAGSLRARLTPAQQKRADKELEVRAERKKRKKRKTKGRSGEAYAVKKRKPGQRKSREAWRSREAAIEGPPEPEDMPKPIPRASAERLLAERKVMADAKEKWGNEPPWKKPKFRKTSVNRRRKK